MRVFVTIDDLGMFSGVNSAAGELASLGRVHCLSIASTGPLYLEALEIAGEAGLRISVHLNCYQPPFLLKGEFPESHAAWMMNGRKLAGRVRDEWRAQIERILSAGAVPSRLDSHHHLHNAPGLREVALELASEYGIDSMRAAILPDRWRSLKAMLLHGMGRRLAAMAGAMGISTPDLMMGFTVSGRVDRNYLLRMDGVRTGRQGTAELVMHPSTMEDWSVHQVDEYELMRSGWFQEWLGEV